METDNMISLVVICLLTFFKYADSTDCGFSIDALVTKGKMYAGDPLWTTKTSGVRECAVTCIRRKLCAGFTYDMQTGRCDLYDQSSYLSPSTNNTVSSSADTWPSQIDPNCYDRPCDVDEVCIPGILAGASSCSYMCMQMVARCPLIEGITSNGPRTVGTNITFTCEAGYRGQDSATCLSSLQWDREINTTCTLIHESPCAGDDDCEDIDGVCDDDMCQCQDDKVYDTDHRRCLKECDENWVRFEDGCYLFDTVTRTFDQAETFCDDNDAHIVQVETSDEFLFIKTKLSNDTQNPPVGSDLKYWTGLQNDVTGTWTWKTTGEEMNLDNVWGYGQPTLWPMDCVVFLHSIDFLWASEHCYNAAGPICEK